MAFTAASLLLGLLLTITNSSGHKTTHGNNSCSCIKMSSEVIPLHKIVKVIVIPPKDGCKNIELMFFLADMKNVCVDPKSKWVQNVLGSLSRLVVLPTRKPVKYRNYI